MGKSLVNLCWMVWISNYPLVLAILKSDGDSCMREDCRHENRRIENEDMVRKSNKCAPVDVDMLLLPGRDNSLSQKDTIESIPYESWQIREVGSKSVVSRGPGSLEISEMQWLAVGSYHLELVRADDFPLTRPGRHGSAISSHFDTDRIVRYGLGISVGNRFAGFLEPDENTRFLFEVLSTDCPKKTNPLRRLRGSSSSPSQVQYPVKILIIADAFPREISWTLYKKEEDGDRTLFRPVLQGGAKSRSSMLVPGTYDFQMTDAAGDGICCSFDFGSFLINVNGQTAYRGAKFDSATDFLEFTLLEDGQLSLPSLPSNGGGRPLQPSPGPTSKQEPSRLATLLPTSAAPTSAAQSTMSPTTGLPTTTSPTTGPTTTTSPTTGPTTTTTPTTGPTTTTTPTALPSTEFPTTALSTISTERPTASPTSSPTTGPSRVPPESLAPTAPTSTPSQAPAFVPTGGPVPVPTLLPTLQTREVLPELVSWSQQGEKIEGGNIGDSFGRTLALSSDGSVVAVGVTGPTGTGSGQIQVFEYEPTTTSWNLLGSDIEGCAEGEISGYAVDLSANGRIVALGAISSLTTFNSGSTMNQASRVRVFSYTEETMSWNQLGQDLDGDPTSRAGNDIALSSDGMIVAVGASDNFLRGRVRVYRYNLEGQMWIQMGDDLLGELGVEALFGQEVELSSDGTVLAVGALGLGGMLGFGRFRVFEYNGASWIPMGQVFEENFSQDISQDFFIEVALSGSGNVLALSTRAGINKVFQYNGNLWIPLGQDLITPEALDARGFRALSSSLSDDGMILAASAAGSEAPFVHVHQFNGTSWNLHGEILENGGIPLDTGFGEAVSISSDGSVLAVGAPGTTQTGGAVIIFGTNA